MPNTFLFLVPCGNTLLTYTNPIVALMMNINTKIITFAWH